MSVVFFEKLSEQTDYICRIALIKKFIIQIIAFSALDTHAFGKNLKLLETVCTISKYVCGGGWDFGGECIAIFMSNSTTVTPGNDSTGSLEFRCKFYNQ